MLGSGRRRETRKGTIMLPDYRTARAIQELRLQGASDADQPTSTNPGIHSLIERVNLQIEAKLHGLRDAYRNRSAHPWHWPYPLRH